MKTQELQLLYIFDAIMTERSVTRAADRLESRPLLEEKLLPVCHSSMSANFDNQVRKAIFVHNRPKDN